MTKKFRTATARPMNARMVEMRMMEMRMTKMPMMKMRMMDVPISQRRPADPWLAGLRHALVALVVAMTFGALSPAHAGTAAKFDATRDAKADVAAATSLARSEGKNVLVDVGGEWCIWCHILDGFFDDDSEARALRDRYYVVVKVNWSPQNHNAPLLSQWPAIPGYPHLFVLDGEGKLLRSQSTGELERGRGYDRDKIIAFLRRYAPPPAAQSLRSDACVSWRDACCASAHSTCSRTIADASSRRARSASTAASL